MKATVLAMLLLASCILAACTRFSPNAQLVQADSLIQKLPDSALRFLQSIQSKEFHSAADRAYYALLLTQVKDKNFILQTEDSLIRIAVQYYDSTKNTAMQARAHYYLGCIWRDKEDYPNALSCFLTAISYAKKIPDYNLAGHIYNNIANLYYQQRLNEQADSIYQITEDLAIKQKNFHLHVEVLSQRGMINIREGKYKEAEQILLHAFEISRHSTLKSLIAKTTYSLSLLYGRMNMGEKAVEYAKLSVNNQENINMQYRACLVLGDAYYKTAQYDSALIYLNKGLYSKDHSTKAGIYMRLADIAQKQGLLEKALEMERKYSAYLDSAQQKQQSTAIVTTEKNILIQRKQSEYKKNLGKFSYYTITTIATLLSVFFILWKKYKKRINSLQKELEQHNYNQKEKAILQKELHSLNTERQALLKEAYEHSEVYAKMKRIIQSYKKTDKSTEHFDEEDWKQLIAETDIRWNNITIRLASKYPLSLDEIYLCCLYLTDMPTSHFRYIMECSRDAIYKKTKRILEQKMKCFDKSTSLRDILDTLIIE